MSKTKLFSLLVLGAISLGLVGCEQEQEKVVSEPQPPQQEVIEQEKTVDDIEQEWFERIQEETKHLDFKLIEVNNHSSLDALLNDENNGPWLVFQIDMTRDEYVTYALNSDGKAFEDEFDIKKLSEKYANTLFDLLDSEGYTIYSYENGESKIEVTDWLGDK